MALLPGGAALSMAGGVREFASATPSRPAVIDGDRSLTYRALDDRASRLAQTLLAAGLRPGDRVAVQLGNRLEFPEIICAAAKAGLVLVPIGTRLTGAETAYILEHSGARAFVSDGEPPVPVDLVLTIGGTGVASYEKALDSASGADPLVPVDENDPCCLYYTSGTTGRPKGVLSSHRARTLMCYLSAMEWGLGARRTSLAVAPMYHGAGMVFDYAPVVAGGTVVMLPKWDPEHLLVLAERHRAQSAFLVPTHAQTLRALGDEPRRRYDLSSLDTLYFNAAALPAVLKDWVAGAFPDAGVHELYGSTEAGVVTNCRPADADRTGSVGLPWYMTEVRVVDDEGRPVAAGERGELFSRSPFLMNGYLGDDAATAACTTEDGFLTSGDIVVRDEDGFIYVVDRKKDMIISGGVNIAPREVEDVINAFPGVADTAVVGAPDEQWGERVAAYVVALPGATVDPAALDAHCRERLSGPKVPRSVEFLPVLPRNASGKVLKRELRDR
ncbi:MULTISPECIES: class I adenylate-forming enzyme family protein [Thermomonosporaceae]|uniref:class I adenylate-forming enzyme family protein n=1 Tax=Thermomonosporaceae TaxID=2012 RepID=UPI00255A7BD3|nr:MULTISPECIES: AMP-binding protein [Thermomonosporaceae]MDL4772522.1 AMP-binding protein [Actinomadura xylanilytica]